jgi:ABC-type Fe3+ transport system substrate-binding protein
MSDKKWSEIYSYLAARPADSADKTFELLQELAGGAAGAGAGGGAAASRTSEKEAALLREFEAYAASRDRDVKGPIARR